MDLKDCIDVLLRRKKLFAVVFLVIVAGAAFGLAVITPTYETSAKLYYQPLSLENVSTVIGSVISNRGNTIDDHSHLEMLASSKNVDVVIERLQLRDKAGRYLLQSKLTKSVPLVSALFPRPYLTVQHTSDTFVLEVKATSPDPEQAAMLANTLASVYIEDNRRERLEELARAKEALDVRINDERRHYASLQERLRAQKIEHDVVSLDDEYSSAVEKYYSAIESKITAVKELAATSARIRKLRDQLKNVGIDYIPGVAFTNYPAVSSLTQKISDMENDMAAAKVELKDGHPEVMRYKERLKELNRLLEHALKTFKASDTDLQTLERQEEGNKATVAAAEAAMAGYFANMKKLADNTARISPLSVEISAAETSFSTLVENLFKVISAEALSYDEIRLIQAAVPKRADDVARPKAATFLLVGIFLGVCAGLGLIFLVDYLDESVRDVADARKCGLPVVGVLPGRGEDQEDPEAAGRYRDLRNRLLLARGGVAPGVLLVVGYGADGWAADAALGLGRALAGPKRSVAVVDADFAHPFLRGVGKARPGGLAAALADLDDVLPYVADAGRTGLHVLPAGAAEDIHGDPLDGGRLDDVLGELRQAFAVTIVVAPPLDRTTDALPLAAKADAVLLVARSGRARGAALAAARDALVEAGAPAPGLALIGCSRAEARGLV